MKNFIDGIFDTEFSYREKLKNYMTIQASLIVRETQQLNWDNAIKISTETLNRFVHELDNYRGRSHKTYTLLREYIGVSKQGISDFEIASIVYSKKDVLSSFEALSNAHEDKQSIENKERNLFNYTKEDDSSSLEPIKKTNKNKIDYTDDDLNWLSPDFKPGKIVHHINKK